MFSLLAVVIQVAVVVMTHAHLFQSWRCVPMSPVIGFDNRADTGREHSTSEGIMKTHILADVCVVL